MPRPPRDSWQQVSALLDVAMELPQHARAEWLASLQDVDASAVAAVSAWLGEFDAMQSTGFLEERLEGGPGESAMPRMQVGAYTLVEPIGQGGMGTVWLAERSDGQFQQRAAVKILNVALLGSNGSELFAREAGILARLTHPQIAHLFDAGISPTGTPYLVLEHVDGEHIDRYCDARRLDTRDRVRVFLDVVPPVAHAHANLVVHRDLKLSNVLVTRDGHVKLLDFGIAKLLQPDADADHATVVTRDGALTPACAAPEQLTGAGVTTRTDVYALGVLLYQLLTGHHPSADGAQSPAALIKNIVDSPARRASEVVTEAPVAPGVTAQSIAEARATTPARLSAVLAGDLDTILAMALKKNPSERYSTVTALADDLRRFLRDEPIAALPDSVAYRTAKFVRRHRAPVALAALAVLALVAGLFGTLTQARRATAQAHAAELERARADRQAADVTVQRDFARRQLARAEAINDLNAFLIADAAPVGTTFTARDLLARAVRIVSRQQDDEPDVRVEMLVSLGRLYGMLGETANSSRVLDQAYRMSRSLSDPAVRAQASCALATSVVMTGDPARATQLVDEGLRDLPDGSQFAASRVFCHLCAVSVKNWTGESASAVEHATMARTVAETTGTNSSLMQLRIVMNLAESLRNAGRYQEANEAFADAHKRLVALGREDTERAGTLLNNWGLVLSSMGQPREAERMFRRAVVISTEGARATHVDPILWNNLAQAVFELGKLPEAIALSARSHAAALQQGDAVVADQALLTRARFHIVNGDLDVGARFLAEAESHFRRMFPPTHAAFVAVALERARLAQARGNLKEAAAFVDGAFAITEANPVRRAYLPQLLRRRATIAVSIGRFDEARTSAEQSLALTLERVGTGSRSSGVGLAYLTLGEVHAAAGRKAEARAALTAAIAHLEPTIGAEHRETRRARTLLAGL